MSTDQSTTIDLVSLIEQKSGIRLVHKSTTSGGEYAGMCPFCGAGKDSFLVWPSSTRPHYNHVRGCGKNGDAVQFLREYCNLSFVDACMELGLDPSEKLAEYTPEREQVSRDIPPPQKWQEAAQLIIERAEHYLWHPRSQEGLAALVYLYDRGLSDETIKRARLGYVPLGKDGRWFSESFEWWGIDPGQLPGHLREKGNVKIPNGILIPWFESNTIWKLAMKRPGEQMAYGQVLSPNSGEGLYGVDSLEMDKPAIMVEGEFDALSVQQVAGDLVGCVATGSTTRGRLGRWIADLSLASYVIQGYDDDEAGDEGAEYWTETLAPRCIRFQPVFGKDPNDILKDPDLGTEALRNWVQWGMYAWENAQAERSLYPMPPVPRKRSEPIPVAIPEPLDVETQFERLCVSERVQTPAGPATIWEMSQLKAQIERNAVMVVVDATRQTELFYPEQLEPLLLVEAF